MAKSSACLIVMGSYRSGTSLVSQLLAGLGVYFGNWHSMRPGPNRHNPGGYYQRPEIVQANTRVLESAGGRLGRPKSPTDTATRADASLLDDVDLSWSRGHSRWALKDPRFCITLKTWIDARKLDPRQTGIVRVTRREADVVRSVLRHYEVRNFCAGEYEAAVEMTRLYDEGAIWHMNSTGIAACELNYEGLIADPRAGIVRLAEFLGVEDPATIQRCVRFVGKRRALLRHYLRKLSRPQTIWDGLVKTIHRAKLTAND